MILGELYRFGIIDTALAEVNLFLLIFANDGKHSYPIFHIPSQYFLSFITYSVFIFRLVNSQRTYANTLDQLRRKWEFLIWCHRQPNKSQRPPHQAIRQSIWCPVPAPAVPIHSPTPMATDFSKISIKCVSALEETIKTISCNWIRTFTKMVTKLHINNYFLLNILVTRRKFAAQVKSVDEIIYEQRQMNTGRVLQSNIPVQIIGGEGNGNRLIIEYIHNLHKHFINCLVPSMKFNWQTKSNKHWRQCTTTNRQPSRKLSFHWCRKRKVIFIFEFYKNMGN